MESAIAEVLWVPFAAKTGSNRSLDIFGSHARTCEYAHARAKRNGYIPYMAAVSAKSGASMRGEFRCPRHGVFFKTVASSRVMVARCTLCLQRAPRVFDLPANEKSKQSTSRSKLAHWFAK